MTTTAAPTDREWAPRFWEGADYFAWLRVLFGGRFAVDPPYWYIAAIVSCTTFANTVLRWVQHGLHGDRIAATPVTTPPLFVLGHWRTGTTLLHELLILDDRHTCPDTFACFCPGHTLLSEEFYKRHLAFLMPKKRPMDNMPAGWDRPQEDEFALLLLGQPSPYADVAFPRRPPPFPGSLDLSGLTPPQLRAWKRTFRRFVQTLTLIDARRMRNAERGRMSDESKRGEAGAYSIHHSSLITHRSRRLVLKSPPHTARLPVLLELFPDARFVHIVRDPYVLFASTCNLWVSLARRHGFQRPELTPAVEEKVFREFRVIHERYEAAKHLIPPGRLVEVRYEEFVRDLVGGTKAIYDGLGLGGWEAVRPRVEGYAAKAKGYEPNKWPLTPELRAKVRDRWGDIIDAQGYR